MDYKEIIILVSQYASELFGVNKFITSIMLTCADTFFVEKDPNMLPICPQWSGRAHMQQRLQKPNVRLVDSGSGSKSKFTKVITVITNGSLSGGQLRNVLSRFPFVKHLIHNGRHIRNWIRSIPSTVESVQGLSHMLDHHTIFPKQLTSVRLEALTTTHLRTVPKKINVHLTLLKNGTCANICKNVVSLACSVVDHDLSMTSIVNLQCNVVTNMSFLPRGLTSLTMRETIPTDLSKLTSLVNLEVEEINETTILPTSLTTINTKLLLGVHDLPQLQSLTCMKSNVDDLSKMISLIKLVAFSIDETSVLPGTLRSLEVQRIDYMHFMPSLIELKAGHIASTVDWTCLSPILQTLIVGADLTRRIGKCLPDSLMYAQFRSLQCTKLPRLQLRTLTFNRYTPALMSLITTTNGIEHTFQDAGCKVMHYDIIDSKRALKELQI